MRNGRMVVNGTSFKTVTIDSVRYVEVDALNSIQIKTKDTGVCSSLVNQVEYLLSTGRTLKSIMPKEITGVKYSVVKVYLGCIKKISRKEECSMNPRFFFKYANANGCTRLLSALLG
jgi:hypothetical protein